MSESGRTGPDPGHLAGPLARPARPLAGATRPACVGGSEADDLVRIRVRLYVASAIALGCGMLAAVLLGAWRGLVYLTLTAAVTIMHFFLLDRLLERLERLKVTKLGRRDSAKLFVGFSSFIIVGFLLLTAGPADFGWFVAGASVVVVALVAETVWQAVVLKGRS